MLITPVAPTPQKDAGNPENGDEGLTVPTGGSSNNGNSSTGSNNSDAGSDDISDNNTEKDDKASPFGCG